MNRNAFRIRLIQRSLFHKKAKALLLILAVAMGSSVTTALLNLEVDLRSRMNRELRDYGPNVVVIPDSNTRLIPGTALNIFRGSQILALSPELFSTAEIKDASVMVVGANLPSLKKLHPNWSWNGDINDGSVFVGKHLSERLNLKKDNNVQISVGVQHYTARIAGTVESGEVEDDQLFVPISVAQKLSNTSGFHRIVISVLGDAPEVEKRFSELIPSDSGLTFQLVRKIAGPEQIILNRISNLMSLVIGIIFVILFFCIHTTVSAILLSRQSEIALLRILGARRKQIMAGLTLELLCLALCGGLAGFFGGILMAQLLGKVLFQTFIIPHARVFWITIFSSLAMMVFSSYFPIRKAINRQAAVVLKEA